MKNKRAALYLLRFSTGEQTTDNQSQHSAGPVNRAWGESPSVRRNPVAAMADGCRR